MLNVKVIIVSKMTIHCAQVREESERGIRKWEEMWFKMTAENGELITSTSIRDAPVLRGWRLPSRTWNQWTSLRMKQLTWLRIAHSGDWCLRLVLCTHSGACQKWMMSIRWLRFFKEICAEGRIIRRNMKSMLKKFKRERIYVNRDMGN